MLSFDKVLHIDTQSLSSSERLLQYSCSQENKKEKANCGPKEDKNSKLSYMVEGRRIKFIVSKPLLWARSLVHITDAAMDLARGIWFT